MDVVPANPETWKRDPFKLTVEGDHLYGRGATDCLGHVALLTELMMGLAIERPALQRTQRRSCPAQQSQRRERCGLGAQHAGAEPGRAEALCQRAGFLVGTETALRPAQHLPGAGSRQFHQRLRAGRQAQDDAPHAVFGWRFAEPFGVGAHRMDLRHAVAAAVGSAAP